MRSIILLCILVGMLLIANNQSHRKLDDTCKGFIQALEDADETMDRTRPRDYSDNAERIYAALNEVVVQVGLAPLPLPSDSKSRTARSMQIVDQCQRDMSVAYHDAVADAYVVLRRSAGLTTDVPNR